MRVGIGYDVHRLVAGRKLILGGVEIPHNKGLLGHSDADVLSHAIGDAMLGAANLGDLGKHFPDSDAQFAGISSLNILNRINRLIRKAGYKIGNIDSILVIQKPKVAGYLSEMQHQLSNCLEITTNYISIKATTTEGLGFAGASEGVAAHAIVMLDEDDENTEDG